jgi:hypothetical protein
MDRPPTPILPSNVRGVPLANTRGTRSLRRLSPWCRSGRSNLSKHRDRLTRLTANVTPCSGQLTRGASAMSSQVAMPMSTWRHRRSPPPLSNHGATAPRRHAAPSTAPTDPGSAPHPHRQLRTPPRLPSPAPAPRPPPWRHTDPVASSVRCCRAGHPPFSVSSFENQKPEKRSGVSPRMGGARGGQAPTTASQDPSLTSAAWTWAFRPLRRWTILAR